MTDKWNMIVDVAKCENCRNCSLSAKDEHVGNDFPGYAASQPLHGDDWIKISRKVRGSGHMVDAAYLPTMCNHCDAAPCLKASGADGSVRKRADGIVIIDPVKAKGRRDLVESCPYGSISWNEELEIPQIWIFDAHLIDHGWAGPRAPQACPTGALKSLCISDEKMRQIAKDEKLEVLRPDLKTEPRVYYRNLYRFMKCFIGGSAVAVVNGQRECVVGASVSLLHKGAVLSTQTTDCFGDFKFDDLGPDSGSYEVRVTHPDLGQALVTVVLGDSRFVGSIELVAAWQGGEAR